MATAPASGINPNARMIRLWAVACVTLRPKWSRSRFVRNTARPVRGRISPAQTASDAIARKNRTSTKEYSATCHFDSALEREHDRSPKHEQNAERDTIGAQARALVKAVGGQARPQRIPEACLSWVKQRWQG